MFVDQRLSRLRCGIASVVIILGLAVEGLPVRTSEGQRTVSLKLIQTLSKSEFASWSEPFSKQGVLAIRTGDVVQLWDTETRTLKVTLPPQKEILHAFFSADGETFITSNKEKSSGLVTRLWDTQTGHLKQTLAGLIIY